MLRWKRKNSLTDNTVYVFIPARAIKHSIACFNILPHILVVRWGRFSNFQIVYSFDKFKWNFEFTQNLCWYITRLIYNTSNAYMYHLHNMLTLYCVNVIAAWHSLNMSIISIMLDEIRMSARCWFTLKQQGTCNPQFISYIKDARFTSY